MCVALCALGFWAALIGVIYSRHLRSVRVEATAAALRVVEVGAVGCREKSIPAEDLVSVEVQEARSIVGPVWRPAVLRDGRDSPLAVARCANRALAFGGGLRREELQMMACLIREACGVG